jgi:hypothetical protein
MSAITGCVNCDWTGGIESIQKFESSSYCLSRTATMDRFTQEIGQFGSFPQFSMPDFGGTLACRQSELFAISSVFRYWDKARDFYLKHSKFPPVCILFSNIYKDPEVLPLNSKTPGSVDVLKRNAKGNEVVMVLYTSNQPAGSFTDDSVECPGEYLVANIHTTNVPPINLACKISELPTKWGEVPPIILFDQETDIIWQPVDWRTLKMNRKSATLRYASAFETKDGVNATFGVEENLDTGEFRATGTVRTSGDPTPIKIKQYAGDEAKSAEEAIDLVSQKFKEMMGRMVAPEEKPVFDFEIRFDLDRETRSITNEIQEMPLWKQVVSERMDKVMERAKQEIMSKK